jgi:hypothetical protein
VRSPPHLPAGAAAAALATLAMALLAAPPARAGAFDVEGVGPVGVAELSARAARADDGSAAFYDPGGLAFGRGVRLEIAPTLGVSALSAQGKAQPLEDPFGVTLTFDATVPFTGFLHDRIRLGFAAYIPPTVALRFIAHPADTPFFPYYDNRTQRLQLLPALAVRLRDDLGVGVGLDVLGGVSGPASVDSGASGAPEPAITLDATTSVAVHAGVRFDPSPRAHLALVFRQRFSVPAAIDTTATIAGTPLAVDVATASALFDPMTLVAAASFDLGRASLELDAAYAAWSAYGGPFVGVTATLPGVNVASMLPSSPARDVVSLRAAGTYRLDVGRASELLLRAGAGFEPSMLSTFQQGETNLVDGPKLMGGLGVTFALRGFFPATLRLGAGASVQGVLPYAQEKRVCSAAPCPLDTVAGTDAMHPAQGIDNPGYPRLEGGGAFVSMSLGVGVDL